MFRGYVKLQGGISKFWKRMGSPLFPHNTSALHTKPTNPPPRHRHWYLSFCLGMLWAKRPPPSTFRSKHQINQINTTSNAWSLPVFWDLKKLDPQKDSRRMTPNQQKSTTFWEENSCVSSSAIGINTTILPKKTTFKKPISPAEMQSFWTLLISS